MKQDLRLVVLVIILNSFLTLGCWEGLRQDQMVAPVAAEVLRFRVLANSDSEEDQKCKLMVRDRILDELGSKLDTAASPEEAEQYALAHRQELVEAAEAAVREAGFSYPVSLSVGDFYFPEKTYGDMTFPRGTYRALKVEIGKAAGNNWWCVLYPPLCFTDAVTAEVPETSREKLEHVLTEEDCQMLTGEVEVRSAFLDWVGGLFHS